MKYSADPQIDPKELELQAQGEDLLALARALPLDGVRSILDVGCGPGSLTRILARLMGPDVAVWGIDKSDTHICHARAAARREEIGNVFFEVGDVTRDCDGPPGSRRFDLVLCKYLLMYLIPSQTAICALLRMAEWARPGGRVACLEPDVDFGRDRFPPAPTPLAEVLPRVVEHYRRAGLIEWRSGMQLYSLMRATGLRDVRVSVAYDRVILGGEPSALANHDCLGVEELLEFIRSDEGGEVLWRVAHEQWCAYLTNEANFISTPVYLGFGVTSE